MNPVFSCMLALSRAWRRHGASARRFGVGVWALRLFLLVPSPLAADAPVPAQELRVEDVHIEGRLYSPQAVFIVSRPAEAWGRDAVLPHHLGAASTWMFLPYRLQPQAYTGALSRSLAVVGSDAEGAPSSADSTAQESDVDSRRSQ